MVLNLNVSALKSFFVLIFGLLISGLITPHIFLLGQGKFSANEIYIMGANPGVIPSRFVANPSEITLKQQYSPRQTATRRFHAKFSEDWPDDGPRTLFIPSTGDDTRVFINTSPLPVSKKLPVFAPGLGTDWVAHDIPRWMLVSGQNRLDIHIHADKTRSGLREVFFAPRKTSRRVVRQFETWSRFLPTVTALGLGFIILASFLGLIYGRAHLLYLTAGLLAVILLLQAMMSFIGRAEPFVFFDMALRFALPLSVTGLVIMLWILDQKPWPRLDAYKPAFYILALSGPVAGLAAMSLPVLIPAPLYFATLALISALPLLAVLTGQILLADLSARASRLAELKRTVANQAEDLDEKGQIIALEMRRRAILEERQRFTRDIHDGIGGQLLSLLLRVRSGGLKQDAIADEIQEGLNDLRLVVDSMDHTGDNLITALATFRTRAKAQLQAAGLEMIWKQSDSFHISFPTTRSTLHLYRFIQEVLTNIIRHAKASRVEVSVTQKTADDPLEIEIADNGIGLLPSQEHVGKGLKNLENRAQSLGGALDFGTGIGGKGLGITLTIPINVGL